MPLWTLLARHQPLLLSGSRLLRATSLHSHAAVTFKQFSPLKGGGRTLSQIPFLNKPTSTYDAPALLSSNDALRSFVAQAELAQKELHKHVARAAVPWRSQPGPLTQHAAKTLFETQHVHTVLGPRFLLHRAFSSIDSPLRRSKTSRSLSRNASQWREWKRDQVVRGKKQLSLIQSKQRALNRALRQKTTSQLVRIRRNARARREQLQRLKKHAVDTSATAARGIVSLWRKYGYVGVGAYFGVYVATLVGFLLAASCGILSGEEVKAWAEKLQLQNHIDIRKLEKVDTAWGRVLVAWIATKLVEPIRLFLTLGITPSLAKYLKRFRR